MSTFIDDLKEVKPAYGGDVYSLPLRDADAFYRTYLNDFSKTGENSFLKTLKIPKSFFKNQPDTLQGDLLLSQKISTMEAAEDPNKNVLMLVRDNIIEHCKIADPDTFEDPKTLFNISEVNGWVPIGDDMSGGKLKYFYFGGPVTDKKEFQQGLYIEIPHFNEGRFKIQIGSMRLACLNGMTTFQTSGEMVFNTPKFNTELLPTILNSLTASSAALSESLYKYTSRLRTLPLTVGTADDVLAMAKEKLPHNVIINSRKHLNLVLDKQDQLPSESPERIENAYDLLNLLTFYSHNGVGHINARTSNEKKVNRFMQEYYKDNFGVLPELNINIKETHTNLGIERVVAA